MATYLGDRGERKALDLDPCNCARGYSASQVVELLQEDERTAPLKKNAFPDLGSVKCNTCRNFVVFFLTVSVGALKSASSDGCRYCRFLLRAIETHPPVMTDDDELVLIPESHAFTLEYPAQGTRPDLLAPRTKLTIYRGFQPGAPEFEKLALARNNPSPRISGDTASLETQAKIRVWISECDSAHEECMEYLPGLLPTRILCLTHPKEAGKIFLREPKDEHARFVCLSYCRGSKKVSETTKSNLEARKDSIDVEDLPRTFQEAIDFVRSLGIDYLWIDSLCIIQDDQADVEKEVLGMHEIYKNSYLTVAAAKGSEPDHSLYTDAENNACEFFEVPIPGEADEIATSALLRPTIPHFNPDVGFPLLGSGWFFQVRMMSPRVLYFGPKEALWYCVMGEGCECSVLEESTESHPRSPDWLYHNLFLESHCRKCQNYGWQKAISDYSKLHFTPESDIFPALAGIAKQFSESHHAHYLAGLWQETIHTDLLWYAHKPMRSPLNEDMTAPTVFDRPNPARAPSWSWASTRSPVLWPEYSGLTYNFDVLGLEQGLVNDFLGTNSTTGRITLQGLGVQVRMDIYRGTFLLSRDNQVRFLFPANYISPSRTDADDDADVPIDALQAYIDYDMWKESEPGPSSISQVVLFEMSAIEYEEKEPEVWYLILREIQPGVVTHTNTLEGKHSGEDGTDQNDTHKADVAREDTKEDGKNQKGNDKESPETERIACFERIGIAYASETEIGKDSPQFQEFLSLRKPSTVHVY